MVSRKVEIITKSPFSEMGYRWTSTGEDEFTVEEIKRQKEEPKLLFIFAKTKMAKIMMNS